MTSDRRWLDAVWPFVRAELPVVGSRVIEIGCGHHGGFVPALVHQGYDAVGIDPEAPKAPTYQRIEFENYQPPQPVDAIIACISLHHVADLDDVLDRVVESLVPGGLLVVVEWAWERFDEATAKWCFSRLDSAPAGSEHGWLHKHRNGWAESGLNWDAYWQGWAKDEGLHTGRQILQAMDVRFGSEKCTFAPYFFPDLTDTSEADEQLAISAGQIQANGIHYSASLPNEGKPD